MYTTDEYFNEDYVQEGYALTINTDKVSHFDLSNLRIYLNEGVTSYHPTDDIYPEMRYHRRKDITLRRNDVFMESSGNIFKGIDEEGAAHYTGRLTTFKHGWRIVPFDENNVINVTGEQITDTGGSGAACMDLTELTYTVVINYAPPTTEIIRDEESLKAIEHMAFDTKVTIDIINGSSGTENPIGTPAHPCNNLQDAKLIADYRGFDEFYIIKDILVGPGDDVDGFTMRGQDPSKSTITVLAEASALNCTFVDCMLTGILDGECTVKDSVVFDLTYVNGYVYNCLIAEIGEIILGGTVKAYFLNCYSGKGSVHGAGKPTINYGGEGTVLVMHNYNGDISLKGKTGTQASMINLNAGAIEIQASCVAGTIECEGTGSLEDYSGEGCSVYADSLMNSQSISKAVLSADLTEYNTQGTLGEATIASYYNNEVVIDTVNGTSGTVFPVGTHIQPVNNTVDAFLLSEKYQLSIFKLLANVTFIGTDSLKGYIIIAQNAGDTLVTLDEGCITSSTVFRNIRLTGEVNGRCDVYDSMILNLCNFEGRMQGCGLVGGTNICFANTALRSAIIDCITIGEPGVLPSIDYGNLGTGNLSIKKHTGGLKLINKTSDSFTNIHLTYGNVLVDETCTAGIIKITGDGSLFADNSGIGCTINTDGLMNNDYIADAVLNTDLGIYDEDSTVGLTFAKSEYRGMVVIDTNTANSGTSYPVGTLSNPVNNISDALILASKYAGEKLHLHSDLTFTSGSDISKKIIEAHKSRAISVILESGVLMDDTEFNNMQVSGESDASTVFDNCLINNLANMDGSFTECYFDGNNSCRDSLDAHIMIHNCRAFDRYGTYLACNQAQVTIQGWVSHLILTDKTGINQVNFNALMGKVVVDNTCTEGVINLSGIAYYTDNSAIGCTVLTSKLNNRDMQADAVIDYNLTGYSDHATLGAIQVRSAYDKAIHVDLTNASGEAEPGTVFPTGMEHHPVDNIPDMLTLLDNFHLTDVIVGGDTLLPINTNLNGICFKSNGSIDRTITIPDTASTSGTKFNNVVVTGTLNGKTEFINCQLDGVTGFRGTLENCAISGTLNLDDSTGQLITLDNCRTGGDGAIPTLYINNSKLSIVDWKGSLNLESKTGTSILGISTGTGGNFNVKASCTTGMMILAGVGTVDIEDGTSTIVNHSNLLNTEAIWGYSVALWIVKTLKSIKALVSSGL